MYKLSFVYSFVLEDIVYFGVANFPHYLSVNLLKIFIVVFFVFFCHLTLFSFKNWTVFA